MIYNHHVLKVHNFRRDISTLKLYGKYFYYTKDMEVYLHAILRGLIHTWRSNNR